MYFWETIIYQFSRDFLNKNFIFVPDYNKTFRGFLISLDKFHDQVHIHETQISFPLVVSQSKYFITYLVFVSLKES